MAEIQLCNFHGPREINYFSVIVQDSISVYVVNHPNNPLVDLIRRGVIMRTIKGIFLKKVVSIIRSDKSGTFDRYFTEEDKQVINSTILSSSWYPFDVFKKCFNALADVFANGDMEVCRQWGVADGEELDESIYKTVVKDRNYKVAFEKIKLFWKLQFNFGGLDLNFVSDNQVQATITNFDPDFEVFYWFTLGHWEKILEYYDLKNIQSEFLTKSWEGAGDTTYQFSWTS